MKSGITNKVSVQYDPTWSNFIEPSKFVELLGDFNKDLDAWAKTYKTSYNSTESKEAAAQLYEMALDQQRAFEGDIALSSDERVELLAIFKPVVDGLFAAKSGTLSSLRVSSDCTDILDCLSKGNISAVVYWLGCYKKVLSKVLLPFCDTDSQNNQQCGIVPKVLWENSESSFPAVAAGVIDGIYLTLKPIEDIRYAMSQAIACLNTDYIFDENDCQKKVKDAIGIMQAICGVVNNPLKIIAQFSDEIERITTRADDLGRVGDYYSGRAAFEFISIFVQAERIAPVLKGVNLSKAASFVKSAPLVDEQFKAVSKMLSEVGVTFRKKLPGGGVQFIIREGSITKVVGEYVDGVYKFYKQKTTDFKKLIGVTRNSNYDIPGANGAANKKGKADIAIYVKEKPNSTKADDVAVEAPKTSPTVFKSFTSSNFRHNLGQLTGNIPANSQAHHVFPQKYISFFNKAGVNIHEPKFGAWWETSGHLKNAAGYNAKWDEYIIRNPNATQSQILDKGRHLMQQYGIYINY